MIPRGVTLGTANSGGMRFARTDRSPLADWWFTVDRPLLAGLLVLLLAGVIFSLAAGPAVALKKGLEPFYFVERHALFALAGATLMLGLSFCAPVVVRRISFLMLVGALVLMVYVVMFGVEVNGARRWVKFLGQSLQPSEFLKPAFVVLVAWLLAEQVRTSERTVLVLASGLLAVSAGLLMLQPDLGQSLLLVVLWGGLFFIAGYPLRWLVVAGGVCATLSGAAYALLPHVRARISGFLDPAAADTYQVDRAVQSFREGGWFGRGPGEGTIKSILPDAHTDFILAVIAEEYGIAACLVLVGLFVFVVLRAIWLIWRTEVLFARHAAAGLVMLLALQTFANMGVNVGLLPAKGVTLPFLSYGGSSLIAMSIAMGMLLALTRKGIDVAVSRDVAKKSRFAPIAHPGDVRDVRDTG